MSDIVRVGDQGPVVVDGLTGVNDEMFGIDCETRQIWRHGVDDTRWRKTWAHLPSLPDGDKASTIYIHTEFEGHESPESNLRVFTVKGIVYQYNHWQSWWSKVI